MQQASAPNPFPLGIVIALAAIAISGSKKKWRTTLIILGWTVAGFAVGTGVGYALGSPAAAGGMAVVLTVVMGAGVSIMKISENRKSKQ
jgi:hypothetical protein